MLECSKFPNSALINLISPQLPTKAHDSRPSLFSRGGIKVIHIISVSHILKRVHMINA